MVEEGQDLGVSTVTPLGEPDEAGMIEPPHQLQADDLLGEPPQGVEVPDPRAISPRALIRLCDSPMIHPPRFRGRRVDRSADRPNSGVDAGS